MKFFASILSLVILVTSCGRSAKPVANGTSPRSYKGSASVGDFLALTLDPVALTITYRNVSNGDTGVVPYTVNLDGTYTLNDPAGNLVAAYEVPNYAMLVQAAKTGPTHDKPALITAVESGPISIATWANRQYNYMQFRTAAGGIEVGSANMDPQGNISISSYWPYGALNNSGSPFNAGSFSGANIVADPSGTFLKLLDNGGGGSFDYIFGTANGVFAVDTPAGAILALEKASSKNFDPTFAGTYKAIFYEKTGATTGIGNVETGTPNLGNATMVIDANGQITVQDAQGTTLVQATLTPVADAAYLVGVGKLQDPCFGLFTFRVTTLNSQRDVFVSFQGQSILFSSFSSALPWVSGDTYDYLYGVGLK